MRVVFFTHYTEMYGANRSLLHLIDGLAAYGVKCYVISPAEGHVTVELRKKGIPLAIIPFAWWMGNRYYSGRFYHRWMQERGFNKEAKAREAENKRSLPFIVKQIEDWGADVIYSNSSVINIGFLASRKLNLPHVWHFREFGKEDYGLYRDYSLKRFSGQVHDSEGVIAISQAIRYHILSLIENREVNVIYNGVLSGSGFDEIRNRVQNHSPRDEGRFVFSIVGLIQPGKGQEEAIEALALVKEKHPTIKLIIAGSGNKDRLLKLISRLDLKNNVEFLGYVSDPYSVYLDSDAVLMCSRNEGMGRVTIEAMASCKPVIGYSSGGTPELVSHEYSGLLYKHGAAELAECMVRLIEDRVLAQRLGENGHAISKQRFSIETYAAHVMTVIEKAVEMHRKHA